MLKMYCIIRDDLSDYSYKACQGGHAIAEYFIQHGIHEEWKNGTMVYLKVKNEKDMLQLINKLKTENVKFSAFIEPDIGNQYTALSCIDTGVRFKNLSLL